VTSKPWRCASGASTNKYEDGRKKAAYGKDKDGGVMCQRGYASPDTSRSTYDVLLPCDRFMEAVRNGTLERSQDYWQPAVSRSNYLRIVRWRLEQERQRLEDWYRDHPEDRPGSAAAAMAEAIWKARDRDKAEGE
jgi:hypothetical protein